MDDPASPSLRGSGLKYLFAPVTGSDALSPSLRGSGLKFLPLFFWGHLLTVSLFTREWIEIFAPYARPAAASGLPLYEGVD